MKRAIVLCLWLVVIAATQLGVRALSAQNDPSLEIFWTKFKTAVIKGDKSGVVVLSQFPIEMPYGVPAVRNSVQLVKRFNQVFNGETNAAKCFAEAHPVVDTRNRFTVGCKNSAGDEVIIYSFIRTKVGWKFKSLDNINE
jgi:hypothetical protein